MSLRDVMTLVSVPVAEEIRAPFAQRLEGLRDDLNSHQVDDCLALVRGSPTLVELLCVAYVVNGGILLRSRAEPADIDMESFEQELLQGMSPRGDADP